MSESPPPSPQKASWSYLVAYEDSALLKRDELRPVRLQLEMWKTDLVLREHGIQSTVAIFGSSRILERHKAEEKLAEAQEKLRRNPSDPQAIQQVEIACRMLEKSRYYDEARKLAAIVSKEARNDLRAEFFVVTGGGPGIMEAANRGAHDMGAESLGLNIILPFEQQPNEYITPELCFQFHYFAIRKMHFLMRAKALVAFPGGYGTLDEFFEILTLIQTKKIKPLPVILLGKNYWQKAINFEFLRDEGTISPEDLHIFRYAETAEEAWKSICEFYVANHTSNSNHAT